MLLISTVRYCFVSAEAQLRPPALLEAGMCSAVNQAQTLDTSQACPSLCRAGWSPSVFWLSALTPNTGSKKLI